MKNLDFAWDKLDWLIKVRFYVLIVQYPLSLVGYYFGYLSTLTIVPFLGLNTIFLCYNFWLHQKNVHPKFLFQLMLDVLVFTFLLSLSGGPTNPFYVFFHFFAVLGGVFASGRNGIKFLIFLFTCILWTHLFFNFHVYKFQPNVHLFINLFVQLLVSNIIFTISRHLGHLLRQHQKNVVQLALQNARLDRLRALGSLSAGFSHEFSSPLNTLKIRLKRLSKKIDAEDEDLEEAQLAALECEEVLRKMNASQIDHRAVEMKTISLHSHLIQIINKWKELNPEVTIEVQPFDPEIKIKVPLINFAQTILNLLDNAKEAMLEENLIKVKVEEEENTVILAIIDKGQGLIKEVLDHIGEPFNTSKSSGTGLGLYTVMLFMDSVQGSCIVENNQEGPGAIVRLNFPRIIDGR